MDQKIKAVVRVGGKEYTIRAFETEEYIHRVAIYVNRKMEEIEKAQPSLSTSMIAVLAALNLGDEVLKLQDEVELLRSQLRELEQASRKLAAFPAPSTQSAPPIYDVSRKGTVRK